MLQAERQNLITEYNHTSTQVLIQIFLLQNISENYFKIYFNNLLFVKTSNMFYLKSNQYKLYSSFKILFKIFKP